MHVVAVTLCGASGEVGVGEPEHVDDVVVRGGELRLSEKGQQALVTAVSVDEYDFGAAVACHLISGFLQQVKLQVERIGDGAGLVLGFEDLSEVVGREDNRVLLLRRLRDGGADIEEVGAEGKVRSVFLDNADGQDAGALCLCDGFDEIGCGQLFPSGGERSLAQGCGSDDKECENELQSNLTTNTPDSIGLSLAR